ncbi:MAG: ABC transporter permease [Sneathiellales bacterium]|nr:ABC transporter permease [Sneathiellales bacterium]
MNIPVLAFRYLLSRPLMSAIYILLMALGMATITSLLLFSNQLHTRFLQEARGIDVVVGAKGSPLQLILSTVQHMDIPSGNIPYAEAMRIKRNRSVKSAIPLALGDRYHNWRIVGSEPLYLEHFKAEFQEGALWSNSFQVVLGAEVAASTGMRIGSAFVGDHGLAGDASGHVHDEHPYRVVGILKPTGRVVDRLILTSLESVIEIHEEEGASREKEITALLLTYRTKTAAFSFPRQINSQTSFLAASPSFELSRLIDLVGIGQDTLLVIGGIFVGSSLLSILIGLFTAISQRKYDLALFRSLGAGPRKIFTLILTEGMLLVASGILTGILLGYAGLYCIGRFTEKGQELGLAVLPLLPNIFIIGAGVAILSLVIISIPAIRAYRADIQNTLMTKG